MITCIIGSIDTKKSQFLIRLLHECWKADANATLFRNIRAGIIWGLCALIILTIFIFTVPKIFAVILVIFFTGLILGAVITNA
jgi:hypothetical protein